MFNLRIHTNQDKKMVDSEDGGTMILRNVKVKQSLQRPITGPEGSRRLKLPDFEAIGT